MSRIASLSREEMLEIRCSPITEHTKNLFTCGFLCHNMLWLETYDKRCIAVPLNVFSHHKINFDAFSIIDHGHAIAFGEWEVAEEFIWDEYNRLPNRMKVENPFGDLSKFLRRLLILEKQLLKLR